MRNPEILSRQLRLIALLVHNARGLSSERLAALLSISRPTVDRDLRLLRERVALPIERLRVNGEVWHRFTGMPLRLSVSPLQLAALALARDALAPLAGTTVVREIDGLLRRDGAAFSSEAPSGVRVRGRVQKERASVAETLESAITSGRRVQIVTRIASRGGALREYIVEPITVRLTEGEAYLDAWSVESDALRTFKLARVISAITLPERANVHSDVDLDTVFQASVKTWSGDVSRVRIRVPPPTRRCARLRVNLVRDGEGSSAHAEMRRGHGGSQEGPAGFLRPRGDAPTALRLDGIWVRVPPPTRRCAHRARVRRSERAGSSAHAEMRL